MVASSTLVALVAVTVSPLAAALVAAPDPVIGVPVAVIAEVVCVIETAPL